MRALRAQESRKKVEEKWECILVPVNSFQFCSLRQFYWTCLDPDKIPRESQTSGARSQPVMEQGATVTTRWQSSHNSSTHGPVALGNRTLPHM